VAVSIDIARAAYGPTGIATALDLDAPNQIRLIQEPDGVMTGIDMNKNTCII
jgi:hypothetical protein